MNKAIETGIPNVRVSDLEKIIEKIHEIVEDEDAEISFEFIIASLFPTSWNNIQNALSQQYTKGYIQGRKDKAKEIHGCYYDDDSDCYCE
jgi:hypothetical protein